MISYKKTIPNIRLVMDSSSHQAMKITSAKDAAILLTNLYDDSIGIYESVYMITLNQANNTTGFVQVSTGGITGCVVDIRLVAKYAVEMMATGVILCHNHPSGNLSPSHADAALTQKVKAGLDTLDIRLLDHIILSPEAKSNPDMFYSFQQEGRI